MGKLVEERVFGEAEGLIVANTVCVICGVDYSHLLRLSFVQPGEDEDMENPILSLAIHTYSLYIQLDENNKKIQWKKDAGFLLKL
jgi:hypothetical protein